MAPFRKRTRARRPVRTYKKRRIMRRPKSRIPKVLSLGNQFPARVRCHLPYVVTFDNTAGVSPPYEWVFRGNSIRDPDQSGTGHRPRGTAQFQAIYNNYRVYACKFEANIQSSDNAALSAPYVYLFTNRSDTPISNSYNTNSQFQEIDKMQFKMLGALNTGKGTYVLKSTKTSKSQLGANNDPGESSALITADPIQQWYWHLIWNSPDNATSVKCMTTIRLTYYVEFFNQTQYSAS